MWILRARIGGMSVENEMAVLRLLKALFILNGVNMLHMVPHCRCSTAIYKGLVWTLIAHSPPLVLIFLEFKVLPDF